MEDMTAKESAKKVIAKLDDVITSLQKECDLCIAGQAPAHLQDLPNDKITIANIMLTALREMHTTLVSVLEKTDYNPDKTGPAVTALAVYLLDGIHKFLSAPSRNDTEVVLAMIDKVIRQAIGKGRFDA